MEETRAIQRSSSSEGDDSSARSIDEVHAAWLAAGARGDAETMRRLRRQNPQWLDLQQVRVCAITCWLFIS